MPRQITSLNDDRWHFGQVPRLPFIATDVDDLAAITAWLPATVPGNVRTNLLALDHIPDLFFDEGYKKSLWVEDVDWWYRRIIQIDSPAAGQRAFVSFDGIDYLSAIFVNGQEVARHEGMFSRQIIEVTEALQTGGTAEIAVRVWGSSALPQRQLNRLQRLWQKVAGALHGSWVGVYPDRSATLKCQMSFGWDFAPPIRTMGIWDDVRLIVTGPVFMAQVSAVCTSNLSPRFDESDADSPRWKHKVTLKLTLNSGQAQPVRVSVQVTPANFEAPAIEPLHFSLNLSAGDSTHRLQCNLPEVKVWHPWDRGHPHLYNLTITLTDLQGYTLDTVQLRTGFRSVKMEGWQCTINNEQEFLRGLNWVPADCFPGRMRPEDYERLLTMAKDSGANLLRIWGGGLREKQAFYDLCDELGLLVWQEFPFACIFLGSYPRDSSYLEKVKAECGAIVSQLNHHPAIILWCGGNEFSRQRNRPLLNTLAGVVEQHDGSRPFIPTSPGPGDAHHWYVWHGDAPIQTYQTETASFLSEFGLQALPHLDTLTAALSTPANLQSWPTHHADLPKLTRYNEQLAMNNEQPEIHNLEFTIHHSQLMQAIALQTAIEHMRRRKGEAGGVCLWQFNEPWPAISWAIVDYFGRPKLAYQHLKHWYSPVLISLSFPVGQKWRPGQTFTAEIWAINDSSTAIDQVLLRITLDDMLIHTQSLDICPNQAQQVGTLRHQFTTMPHRLKVTAFNNSKILCQNSYHLNWFDASGGSLAQRFRRLVAHWVLR